MSSSAGRLAASALLLALLGSACTSGAPGTADRAMPEGGPLFADLDRVVDLPTRPVDGASSPFWEWWGDGRAELSGYHLTVERYGERREGELALIYVTEPHDRRTWIKDDEAEGSNRVEVLKLNVNAAFLTGIYPYSVMTSVFAPVDRYREEPFQPVRIVHSAQEWCGAYSHRLWAGPEGFRSLRLSYFAGEDERVADVDTEPGTLYEDALLIQLRELDGPFAGGEDWQGLLVPALWRVRAGHGNPAPERASISRESAVLDTPEGEVPVTRFTIEAGEYRRTIDVEREAPRRVLRWRTSTGEEAELLATERLSYWELNRSGDESYREALGLSREGPVPPGIPRGEPPAGDPGDGAASSRDAAPPPTGGEDRGEGPVC